MGACVSKKNDELLVGTNATGRIITWIAAIFIILTPIALALFTSLLVGGIMLVALTLMVYVPMLLIIRRLPTRVVVNRDGEIVKHFANKKQEHVSLGTPIRVQLKAYNSVDSVRVYNTELVCANGVVGLNEAFTLLKARKQGKEIADYLEISFVDHLQN